MEKNLRDRWTDTKVVTLDKVQNHKNQQNRICFAEPFLLSCRSYNDRNIFYRDFALNYKQRTSLIPSNYKKKTIKHSDTVIHHKTPCLKNMIQGRFLQVKEVELIIHPLHLLNLTSS